MVPARSYAEQGLAGNQPYASEYEHRAQHPEPKTAWRRLCSLRFDDLAHRAVSMIWQGGDSNLDAPHRAAAVVTRTNLTASRTWRQQRWTGRTKRCPARHATNGANDKGVPVIQQVRILLLLSSHSSSPKHRQWTLNRESASVHTRPGSKPAALARRWKPAMLNL